MNEQEVLKQIGTLNQQELIELYWNIHKSRYEQRPPTIDEFIEDEYYLGNGKIGLTLYPFWREKLRILHPTFFTNPYEECLMQGAIGIGKSLGLATVSMAYEICKLLCYVEPQLNFKGLSRNTTIVFMIFSANLTLAEGVNWEYMESFFGNSPFFQKHVILPKAKRLYDKGIDINKNIRVEVGSVIQHALGKAVLCAELDEANFHREKTRQAEQSYLGLAKRRRSRFMGIGGTVPGIMFLISQPEDKESFLQRRIDAVKESTDTKTLIIENVSQWEVKKHLGIYNSRGIPNLIDKTFQVYLGNDNADPLIIYPDQQFDQTNLDGEIIDVPLTELPSFEKDLIESIKQIAGRSAISSVNLIRSKGLLSNVMTMPNNKFNKEIITLDFFDEKDNLIDYITNEDSFRHIMNPECKRFIHIDIGATRDRMGICCAYADSEEKMFHRSSDTIIKSEQRMYFVDWVIAIEAKKKQEIPFNKVVEFLIYINSKLDYPINLVTTDQREGGRQMRQDLNLAGIKADYLSVDKTREPYLTLRSLIRARKIIMPKHDLLYRELIKLRDDGKKVDHPPEGSKDVADALCGAVFNAFSTPMIFNPIRLHKRIEEKEFKEANTIQEMMKNSTISNSIIEQFSRRF
jgi:hypothetical protein